MWMYRINIKQRPWESIYLYSFRDETSHIATSAKLDEVLDISGILLSIWAENTSVGVWV